MSKTLDVLDLNLDEVPEKELYTDSDPVELDINSAKLMKKGEEGDEGFSMRIAISFNILTDDDREFETIFHALFLPISTDETGRANDKKRKIKAFCDCFGIDTSGTLDIDTWKGLTGFAHLKVTSDPEYGDQNAIQRLVKK